ncbi:MAG: hypothetical protein JW904_14990 [Spirochaetales bacterium]|nr:hypothetical protein [Spirochaetales bacterium]
MRLPIFMKYLFIAGFVILSACTPPNNTVVYNGSLIISEVGSCPYSNISSWLEVYNNSSEVAQLSDFKLRTASRMVNSPYTWTGQLTFSLPSLLIQPGSYAIIRGKIMEDTVNGERIVYVVSSTDLVPNWVFDGTYVGSGIVELLKNGVTVDCVKFGSTTINPTTANSWAGGNAPELPITTDGSGISNYGKSISRDGSLSDTNTAADWTLHDYATAGGPNDVPAGAVDADEDGIPDYCEAEAGRTFAGLPLYDWGARTGVRDIFIHIDHMDSTDPGVMPRKEALDKMVAAFTAKGIAIHFDVGNLYHPAAGSNPTDYDLDDTSHLVPFSAGVALGLEAGKANLYEYKYTYMPLAKKQVFHYMLYAYSQEADGAGGSSGVAELNGNDLIITLGNWGLNASTQEYLNQLINYQASTMMHEFGHNLGLYHGGNVSTNYMPNYYSIMNYMYQLSGLPTPGDNEGDRYYYFRRYSLYYPSQDPDFDEYLPNGSFDLTNNRYETSFIMDYSDGSGSGIDETAAMEADGLGRSTTDGIDFDGNGDRTGTVNKNLNEDLWDHDSNSSTAMVPLYSTFSDYNDWLNINLFFQRSYSGDVTGATSEDVLPIAPDPVGNDRQEYIVETLTPDSFRR